MEIPVLKNFNIFEIKVLGATNYQPCRIKIISPRFRQSTIIPFSNHPGTSAPALDSAKLYLIANGFNLIGNAESKEGYYIISDTFEPLK